MVTIRYTHPSRTDHPASHTASRGRDRSGDPMNAGNHSPSRNPGGYPIRDRDCNR